MKLQSGEWTIAKAASTERGLWLVRSGQYGRVYDAEPIRDIAETDGYSRIGFIRSFCWGLFSRITDIHMESGECGKYKLVKKGGS